MFSKHFSFDTVTSTMEMAQHLLQTHQPPFYVQAEVQTQGYGRQGRPWIGEKGNIYLTLVVTPPRPCTNWHELSFVTAIAVFKTVQSFLDETFMVQLKWPNDVLVEGKKIAGILLETQTLMPDVLMIGIGLNVCNAPFEHSTCLKIWQKAIDYDEILKSLLLNFEMVYTLWQKEGFKVIIDMWRENGPKYASTMKFQHKGNVYEGLFESIDDQGWLHLKTPTGLMIFKSGDVIL